jgi:FKBP-type peptidyl-prolyl cis-trans isomerase
MLVRVGARSWRGGVPTLATHLRAQLSTPPSPPPPPPPPPLSLRRRAGEGVEGDGGEGVRGEGGGQEGWERSAAGVWFQELREGRGRVCGAEAGERVVVHYSALVQETDKLVESTYQAAYPVEFALDDGHVLPGLNEGVKGMRAGGRRLLVVPPHLAYGRFSDPPNASLLVDVELLELGVRRPWWRRVFE